MRVTFLGTTSETGNCPTLFATDRGTLIAQGKIVTDAEALKAIRETYAGLGDDETVVKIPAELLRFADHDEPRAAERKDDE
jgi:hypothetical protein